jgi:hypothetical protein
MCKHCEEVQTRYEIRSPNELKKAIRVVRANLKDGTIVKSSYWPEGIIKLENEPFENIKESGSYEDVMQYYFECPKCKQVYSLSCETYHGCGGEWSQANVQSF